MEDKMVTTKISLAVLVFLHTRDKKNIRTKTQNKKEKEPTSNMVPKKDNSKDEEKIVERKRTKRTNTPEDKSQDLGKFILPS